MATNSVWIGWFGPTQGSSSGSGPTFPNVTVTGQFIGPAADNTAAPPFTFLSDLTTGIASPVAGTVAIRSTGSTMATFASTQSGASEDSNLFRFDGTLNTTNTAIPNGVFFSVTSAGSSTFSQRAMQVVMVAGYTGDRSTVGIASDNRALGTGADGFFGFCNIGASFQASANGTGDKVGVVASAARSSVRNIGAVCQATFAPNSPQHQIGVAGFALNGSATNVAGYFGLQAAAPTLGISAAIVADNGAVAAPIAVFRDNGTTVAAVADAGVFQQLVDGSGGGYFAGATSDVQWYRGAANTWQTPDSVLVGGYIASRVNGAAVGGYFAGAADDVQWYRNAADVWRTPDSVVVDGTLAVGTRQTYTATNVTTDRSFDADTVVVAELADVVGTLIADLRTIGLVL